MLGHTMGTQRLYELLREVQKYFGGLGEDAPGKFFCISQPPKSVLKPYVYGKLARTVTVRDS